MLAFGDDASKKKEKKSLFFWIGQYVYKRDVCIKANSIQNATQKKNKKKKEKNHYLYIEYKSIKSTLSMAGCSISYCHLDRDKNILYETMMYRIQERLTMKRKKEKNPE